MVNMTLAIPEILHKKMRQFTEIRWTDIARNAIEERVHDLEVMNTIASKSRLTAEDAKELSKRINKAATKKFLEAK